MDFVSGLLKSNSYDTFLVVVARLTKYGHFKPLIHPYSTKDVAGAFIREMVRLYGFPKSIMSDKDRIFISKFWGSCLSWLVPSHHSQTDGQTEVANQCLEKSLRCFTSDK